MSVRHPVVAGKFYPEEANSILNMLQEVFDAEQPKFKKKISPKQIIGGIVPHAGYKYSAAEAMHFFRFLQNSEDKYDTIVIINPCHYGSNDDLSLDANDYWETPIGGIPLDKELMEFMNIARSFDAQKSEHSAEVILPYLQFSLDYPFKIIPISMLKQTYKAARMLAEKIYKANQVLQRRIVIIASSDFSHHVSPEVGFYNDNLVINRILNNSIRGLYDTIQENGISVCGYGPIMTLMFYSRLLDPSYEVDILARGNSGQKSKEDLVVDYVSAIFYSQTNT
jgi:AmmeMemoRadiSam system protein B